MNESLRRALFRARLSEEDVAAHLDKDPKTVRRWLEGRLPYPRNRRALSDLLGVDEDDLWPEVSAARVARSRPEEIKAIYPHRWAVPREAWRHLFESAMHEIAVLAYSGLFLAEDARLLSAFARKARAGVRVRIALGDPDSMSVTERGVEEQIGDAISAKIRNALTLYRPLLDIENVDIRLHDTTLYNSLYCADSELFVNQHCYGLPAASACVFHLRRTSNSEEMFNAYLDSFEQVWLLAKDLLSPQGRDGQSGGIQGV